MRRTARILGLGLCLSSTACQQELDSAPAADPLEDPWVNSIDEGEPEALVAAPASQPPMVVAAAELAVVDPALVDPAPLEAGALVEPAPGSVPTSTTEVAKLAGASTPAAKSSSPGNSASAELEPEVAPTPSEAAEPAAAAIEPAPKPAEAAKPAPAPAITFTDYAGKYRFSGGSAQRAALTQAIEDAAMQLAMPIRGIGRKRLTNTNPIDDTLDIVVTGDKVQTIFESGFDAECVIEGGTVHWTSKKGDKYKVRVRKKDTKIVQVIEGEDGVKTTVFVLSADRQTLTVHHKITADRLDEPMTYKLTYKRK